MEEKLDKIIIFIKGYMEASRKRGAMYGSLGELVARWDMLDDIFLILNGIDPAGSDLVWGHFVGSEKGYGTTVDISSIVKDINPSEDPYVVLSKLREEYEVWRDEKIEKMKAENVKDM
ncbi:MAG: hypothetical protein OEV59_05250 [Deltaproteobacteria bacterium]|nr:hypothetical protein [Deltaproteobacteria bacterium]